MPDESVLYEPRVGDVGTIMRQKIWKSATEVMSLAGSTVVFIFLSAKKRRFQVNAVLTTDGLDGLAEYVTVEGDFDVAGRWQFQAVVDSPSGLWHCQPVPFFVKANI